MLQPPGFISVIPRVANGLHDRSVVCPETSLTADVIHHKRSHQTHPADEISPARAACPVAMGNQAGPISSSADMAEGLGVLLKMVSHHLRDLFHI